MPPAVGAAVRAQVLREAADYLDACLDCGKIHTWREGRPATYDPFVTGIAESWADPDDSHAYRRRSPGGDLIRALASAGERL